MRLATYAAKLLAAASPDGPRPGAGAVQNEVESVFARLPDEASLEKQVCLSLARTVEQGGTPGIAAGKELLVEIRWAKLHFGLDDEDDEDEDDFS